MKRRMVLQGGLSLLGIGACSTAHAQTVFELSRSFLVCRRPVKVRRNVYELYQEDPNHPIIANYRKAVEVMKARPDSDPTSWAYQANIHGTTLAQGSWPAGAPFATCEHGSQFFLSWHRMYLYFFERILRKACGNPDFALPYWDWATNRRLPPPFRDPTIGVDPNALHDASRNAGINNGDPMPASAVNAAPDLAQGDYFDFQSGVEGTPHGTIHVTIGGNMGNFAGAGRDPIFWLHHCNIDRLWEVWLYTGTGHHNPTGVAAWMNQTYTFASESGALVSLSGAEILDTQTQLRYVYEHTCVSPLILVSGLALAAQFPRKQILSSHAIARSVILKGAEERMVLRQTDRAQQQRLQESLTRFAAPEAGARIVLMFEGIRSDAPANGYLEVYVNLPEGEKPDFESPYYAGNLDFFGADAESRRSMAGKDPRHAEHGLTREIDITDTVQRLYGRGEMKPEDITVTLVPAGVSGEGRAFRLDPKATPTIDMIMLSVVKRTD